MPAAISPTAAGDVLGTYTVRARNIAEDSDNKIHDDAVAREYGFSGGLVPGIVVFGYLTRPLTEHLGLQWLAYGSAAGRFVQPCYDGEEITVRATAVLTDEGRRFDLVATRPDHSICARGSAALPDGAPIPPPLADYPIVALPADPPPATAAVLQPGTRLGTVTATLGATQAAAFARSIGDDLPIHQQSDGIAHPALMLYLANQILIQNVILGPWIHTASEVTHYSLARYGDALSVRGHVAECFERKGHEFVVLDLLVIAGADRAVQHIRHTAIYQPRSGAPT